MNKNRKKYQQQNNGLPELLIYCKKKYIIPGALLLFVAIFLLSVGITLGIVGFAGDDVTKVASEMFQFQNAVYLLPGLAILGVPALLVYALICIGERRFLCAYRQISREEKEELYEKRAQDKHPQGLPVYGEKEYILFSDRCLFGTPQIVKLKDIVWGYIGRSDFQYTDMERNVISPSLRFFSLYFYTKDGRRHRVYVHVSCQEAIQWFISRCPGAITGYGKEQKRQAEEIFRREAEQTAFLTGEKEDSWLSRKKKATAVITGSFVIAVFFVAAGLYTWNYRNSDTYLYWKNMKEADKYFAEEEWSRAYKCYYTAHDYRTDDEEATKGMLLSRLGMAKNDGYTDSIIRDYENLFFHQDLFTDEMDISDWYFDCTEYYLKYDDPMDAIELLDRGMDTFSKEETVVEGSKDFGGDDKKEKSLSGQDKEMAVSEENKEDPEEIRRGILQKMQNKKEDILAHCQIGAVTKYIYGEKREYTQYNEEEYEILNISYFNGYSAWFYESYDRDGNMILMETYKKKDGEEEKQKTREEYYEYDDMGNLLHEERYDLQWGCKVYEAVSSYDEEGNQIYYKEFCDGEIFVERECCFMSDTLRIEREYNADYSERDQNSYMEERWDERGNLLEKSFYANSCSVEEIQKGEAAAQVRYCYMYDEKGNCIALYCMYEKIGESEPLYEREYDDRDNLVKEIYYYRGDSFEDSFVETTVWHYNEENLPVKKERSMGDDTEIWSNYTETYTYDETGNLIRTDHTSGDGTMYCVLKEYDILGNQIKEYKLDSGAQTAAEDLTPDKEWKYQYHYSKENLRWEH